MYHSTWSYVENRSAAASPMIAWKANLACSQYVTVDNLRLVHFSHDFQHAEVQNQVIPAARVCLGKALQKAIFTPLQNRMRWVEPPK